ncbi:inverse autotransporter beta domain-containing protein [Pararhizobium sp.]|uniref:inverse autotransporter beta domain-containing protein n=1 Tax=Pararhizobium sp. TaxID=1977563 RepID=UPI0027188239|nr:inverse autotransporter beta domain-containing protein [Pararhizobium sp.]MDO9415428.1 inverse autotransporter beta domain-containing protein [Pararhizobium sp.]
MMKHSNSDRNPYLVTTVFAVLATFNSPVFASDFNGRWDASVDVGGRVGSGREIGETSLFAPLWQNDASLFFTDLRGSFDDSQAREGNFGLGFRHMLESGWNIGAYGYFDVRRSALGNTFHQTAFGAEALSENFDLRANVYLPVGDDDRTLDNGSFRTTTKFDPELVLTGNQLNIQHVTSTTAVTATLTEKAMMGIDAEVGVRLPVLPDDWNVDLRAFAGGYHFEADGVQNISGPRGRLELSARDVAGLPGVRLTAGLTYQHDQVRGSQWIAGAKLTIPLQAPSKSSELQPLTTMQQRMTEGVVRDVDIVSSQKEDRSSITTDVVLTEAVINTWNEQTVTSVTYLDPTGGAAALNMALGGPAGSVVVLNGALTGVTDVITLGANNTLVGGGTSLKVRGATSKIELDYLATGAPGSITGNPATVIDFINPLTVLQSGSVLGGMRLDKDDDKPGTSIMAATVLVGDGSNASIFGNTITGGNGAQSAGIVTEGSKDLKVYNNKITTRHESNTYGMIQDLFSFGTSSSTVRGNAFETNDAVSAAFALFGGETEFSNNSLDLKSDGIAINRYGGTFQSGSVGNIIIDVGTYFGQRCSYPFGGGGTVSFDNAPDCPN